jgi:hypothetical protein
MIADLSRRGLIAWATAGAAVAQAPAAARHSGYDPRATAEGQVKLTATLDDTPAFWAYYGVVYAISPQQRPAPILAVSGCQSHWATRQPDGSYRIAGVTLSFFRDLETGAFLDAFDNPLTGGHNSVKPNLLSGGGVVYPSDGSSARAEGHVGDAVIAPKGFGESDPRRALGGVRWRVIGDSVMLMTDRSWNVAVQPQLEAQTQSCDRGAFFDPKIRRMSARYTATTIIPWMTWMEMGDAPGHLVWHTSGEKLFSVKRIPADYRARAGDLMDKLASRPDA